MERDEMDEDAPERESAPANNARCPLARDGMGNPIQLPPGAIAWRVRRGGGRRGRPRHVFDPETGRQLEVPLGAALEDLVDAGCREPDRYLLYPIDAAGNIIPGVIAVTEVSEDAADTEQAPRQSVTTEQAAVSALLAAMKDKQATIDQQQDTIRHALTCMTRCYEAATAGYGRVRAMPGAPVILEQTAPAPPENTGTTQQQMAEYFNIGKMLFEMFRGGGNGGGGAGATDAVPAPGAGP